MTEFSTVTHVGEKHISSRSATPLSQGAGPQRPQILGTYTRTQYEKQQPNFAW